MIRRPPISTLFPYPTLFRSVLAGEREEDQQEVAGEHVGEESQRQREGAHDDVGEEFQRDQQRQHVAGDPGGDGLELDVAAEDRKSTRLNSSNANISYAVFCLNDTATTDIYTLSLPDALPICTRRRARRGSAGGGRRTCWRRVAAPA